MGRADAGQGWTALSVSTKAPVPGPDHRGGRGKRPAGRGSPRGSTAAARDGGLRGRLNQLDARVVGSAHERDPGAVRHLDRTLEERASELLQAGDVRLEIDRVEAEVLEPM